MPKVPIFNKTPTRLAYTLTNPREDATFKQKNYIMTICERRKIPTPDLNITKEEAARLIDNLTND